MENKTRELIQNLMDGFNMAEDDHERAIAGAQLCGALEMILLINQMQEERRMSKRSVDETVITNGILPKSWKCPHCGRRQKFSNEDSEIFLSFMMMIRHCENCGYLHFWKLNLTDDFKRKVADMVVDMAERKEE